MVSNPPRQRIFPIHDLADVTLARRIGLDLAMEIGFHRAEATKVAVVISELGRNIERYAGTGTVTVEAQDGPNGYMYIVAEDHGPGIANVARVLAGGYTTSKGLGFGVSGSKRMMDEFEIQTALGVGTTIRTKKWLNPRK